MTAKITDDERKGEEMSNVKTRKICFTTAVCFLMMAAQLIAVPGVFGDGGEPFVGVIKSMGKKMLTVEVTRPIKSEFHRGTEVMVHFNANNLKIFNFFGKRTDQLNELGEGMKVHVKTHPRIKGEMVVLYSVRVLKGVR